MIKGRNIKLVVVIVVPFSSKDSITEDRMVSLRKQAELDAKYVVTFIPDDAFELNQSLSRLGNIFAELAVTFYRDEGRRIKVRLEKKNYSSIELNIRYCFKVAIYAEFRRDWVEALRMYEDGYHALREMIGTSTRIPAIQRLIEIKMLAEQFHFKISTLLLHGGKIVEAIKWFRQHNSVYRKLTGPPEAIFLHWEWLSRQFLVFAELLESSNATMQSISSQAVNPPDKTLSEWESRPGYYYQVAAQFLKEKMTCVEIALSMPDAIADIDDTSDSIVPSLYVGQFARLLDLGDTSVMQLITDEDYIRFALAEGKKFRDSIEIIGLLKKAEEAYNNIKAHRAASFCKLLMAKEYFSTGDYTNAKDHFTKLTYLYRQEGWVTLLWEVLGYLRECSKELRSTHDYIGYSLEMAALPISSFSGGPTLKDCGPGGSPSVDQIERIHKEVFAIVREELNEEMGIKVNGDNPLDLEIDLVSPLRVVLLTSVAFHEQIVKPHAPTLITLSLLSQLPSPIEIDQLEIQFNQSECNFIIVNAQRRDSSAISHIHPDRRVETVPVLQLLTNKWLRLTYDIKSVNSGKLECTYVIARMGPHFSICCGAESPANMNELPVWKFEDRFESSPTKDPAIAFSGMKVTQVEDPDPQVELGLGSTGPALVGENFILPVTLTSKGHSVHSGELKINLVDTRGTGLLSPREAELSSSDNLYVELLGVSSDDNSMVLDDKIKKIQQTFGLVSVPFLNVGDSWSCNLEIQWHRPKPIMLYVSLGYSPINGGPKVHVHKSLQIEGKTPVIISHRLMLPFRRDPLLLSRIKRAPDATQTTSLPMNETSILVVNATNCTEVPLRLLSMSIESEDEVTPRTKNTCTIQSGNLDFVDPALIVPGEEFKKVFSVKPKMNVSKLNMGSVCLKWRRDHELSKEVVTKQSLPDVNVESPPLIVSLECPPHGVLGEPFTYFARIHNQTKVLQEVKFSLSDSQSFVLSGPHNDTTFVLPLSEYIISYKLVPLSSGSLQLPRVTITSVRYSAGFQPTLAASTIFIFPSKPQFQLTDPGPGKKSIDIEQIPEQIPA
ncbi:uncharacterized protein [Rutidosis leptorrhynchoides]|uniref:uncharacterized protein isoform X2 n=1 Tax=Rutidosis leptorrhynchoides TaxID=125765 RepID=UPI003A997167